MKHKILIEVIVPDIDQVYHVYIPVHKRIGHIIVLLNKGISELSNGIYVGVKTSRLYNRKTSTKYKLNQWIYETDIRNGTSLILL